jgi:hypothetical protein
MALRRDRATDTPWMHLPATGRQGDPPAWPLVKPSRRELELWAAEWRRPQAIEWERNGQELEVALYVRTLKEAEAQGAAVTRRVLVARMQDALGITSGGMLRNRWVIAAGDAPRRPTIVTESARERLTP